jgi:hypothetical protein
VSKNKNKGRKRKARKPNVEEKRHLLKNLFGQIATLVTAVGVIGGLVGLSFSFKPSVIIVPSISLNPQYPFATKFTVTNNSLLWLNDFSSSCTLFTLTSIPSYTSFDGISILDRNIPVVSVVRPQEQQDGSVRYGLFWIHYLNKSLQRERSVSMCTLNIRCHFTSH